MLPLILDYVPLFPTLLPNVNIVFIDDNNLHLQGNVSSLFSPYYLYLFNSTFYLKFNSVKFNEETNLTILSFTKWVDNLKPSINDDVTVQQYFYEKLPVHNKTLCMIGDSLICYEYGAFLRQLLNENDLKYDFMGHDIDTYGFRHNGVSGMTTELFMNTRLPFVPLADSYFILLGTNDAALPISVNQTISNLLYIIYDIKDRCRCTSPTIYLSTLLLSVQSHRSRQVNQILRDMSLPSKVKLIDLEQMLPPYQEWQNNLSDGIHPNQSGCELIATNLANIMV